jgi:hypothetical protein
MMHQPAVQVGDTSVPHPEVLLHHQDEPAVADQQQVGTPELGQDPVDGAQGSISAVVIPDQVPALRSRRSSTTCTGPTPSWLAMITPVSKALTWGEEMITSTLPRLAAAITACWRP